MDGRGVVVLVEQDPEWWTLMATWLRGAGFDVRPCPSPLPPGYTCPGGRGEECPLVVIADLVVLDLCLASDAVLEGTPALELLTYYQAQEKPVVVLGRAGDPTGPFLGDGVAVLRWPPERYSLTRAVCASLANSRHIARPAPRLGGRT